MTRLLLAAVLVGLIVLTVSFFAPQLEKQRAMELENADLEKIRNDLQRQYDLRLQEQVLLRTDREYLEAYIRDRLDMQREGETVVRISRHPDKSGFISTGG
ncbi:MAG: FtsB family cell division protein [Verrucomicrobiales bacterium]